MLGAGGGELRALVEGEGVEHFVRRVAAAVLAGASGHENACPRFAEGDISICDQALGVAEALAQAAAWFSVDDLRCLGTHPGEDGRRRHGAEAWTQTIFVGSDAIQRRLSHDSQPGRHPSEKEG